MRAGLLGDARGAAAPLVALCFTALLASAAVSVDLARVFVASRQLQGMADLAAMSAAQAMGGAATDAARSDAAGTAAGATLAANPWRDGLATVQTDTGVYAPDPTQPAPQRFTAASVNANAARVTLTAPVRLTFAALLTGHNSLSIKRVAIASQAQLAAFSIGSGLASLDGGVANALLTALTGSQVSLSAMNYQALLGARVSLMDYLGALATREQLTGVSYNQLLTSQTSTPLALNALSDALAQEGQGGAAGAVSQLAHAAAAGGNGAAPLSSLFDLGPYGAQDHGDLGSGAAVSLQALPLATAMLSAANGQRQIAFDLGAALPGVMDLKVWLAVGQRASHSPWVTVTANQQVVVSTAQTRLYLQASLAPGPAAALGATALTLPIYVEMASAQARLQSLACPDDPAAQSVTLSANPSLGALAIGQVDPALLPNFGAAISPAPAQLLTSPVLSAQASARVDLGGGAAGWQPVAFSAADIASHATKTVVTGNLAQASVQSLLANTTFQISGPAGGAQLGGGPSASILQAALQPPAVGLDGLVNQLEKLTGAKLGEADVTVDGLRCRGAALVG